MAGDGLDRRVFALAVARMADSLGNSFLIVVLPLFIASGRLTGGTLGLSETLISGLVIGLFGLVSSPLQPFAGRASDRAGRRRVFVVAGLAILAITNAAFAFAGSYLTILGIRAIQGLGVALTITASIALINEYSTGGTRGAHMGIYNTLRMVGFGGGPIFAGLVVQAGPYALAGVRFSGFEAAFYVASAAAVVSILLVFALVRDPSELEAEAGGDVAIAVLDRTGEKLLDPVFTLGLASAFMAMGMALLEAIQPQVNARLGQEPFLFGVEFGAFVFAQLLCQIPVGAASDRWGRRPFLLGGLALFVPATLAQGLVTTPVQMIGARFVQGVAAAAVFAPSLALAGDLAKVGESGTKLSVLTMAFGLGVAVGPIVSGFLIHYGFVVPFVFGSLVATAGFALVYTQVEETVGPDEVESGAAMPTD
ncbi:MAG: MFS transporter [Haloferacaceae archaeon]